MSDNIRTIDLRQEFTIEASPEVVFKTIVEDTSSWWGAPYLMGRDSTSLIIEPYLGGKFYETWGENSDCSALLGSVTQFCPNELLEITGPIGMGGAVKGVVRFQLEAMGVATLIKFSHEAMGTFGEKTSANYGQGWKDLIHNRLKLFVEEGKMLGLKGSSGGSKK